MDIYWYGQAFFKIKGKSTSVLIDPYFEDFTGLKLPKPAELASDIILSTHQHQDHSNITVADNTAIKITGPGEYEVKGVIVNGVAAWHDKSNGSERGKNTIYQLQIDGLNIVHLGDLGDKLTEEQVAEIGTTDILMVPVGGTYTIDAKDASEIVTQLEPKVIIPMHYSVPGLKFPLAPVDNFLKEMGAENSQPQAKLTITKEKLPDEPTVVVLSA